MMNKIRNFFALISGITLLIYLYKLFGSKSHSPEFNDGAKKAAQKAVEATKEELKKVEDKTYSDDEIKERFNG